MMLTHARFVIAPNDPCLDGHFPDRPLVPAVVLLERAFEAAVHSIPSLGPLRGVSAAKFMRPVLPDEVVTVTFEGPGSDSFLNFRCSTDAGLVAQGRFVIGSPA